MELKLDEICDQHAGLSASNLPIFLRPQRCDLRVNE
jgi:hypothetical protein